ncbi:MAG TPA: flagellar hook-length control protein FliK [Rhizomicrobium sp.]
MTPVANPSAVSVALPSGAHAGSSDSPVTDGFEAMFAAMLMPMPVPQIQPPGMTGDANTATQSIGVSQSAMSQFSPMNADMLGPALPPLGAAANTGSPAGKTLLSALPNSIGGTAVGSLSVNAQPLAGMPIPSLMTLPSQEPPELARLIAGASQNIVARAAAGAEQRPQPAAGSQVDAAASSSRPQLQMMAAPISSQAPQSPIANFTAAEAGTRAQFAIQNSLRAQPSGTGALMQDALRAQPLQTQAPIQDPSRAQPLATGALSIESGGKATSPPSVNVQQDWFVQKLFASPLSLSSPPSIPSLQTFPDSKPAAPTQPAAQQAGDRSMQAAPADQAHPVSVLAQLNVAPAMQKTAGQSFFPPALQQIALALQTDSADDGDVVSAPAPRTAAPTTNAAPADGGHSAPPPQQDVASRSSATLTTDGPKVSAPDLAPADARVIAAEPQEQVSELARQIDVEQLAPAKVPADAPSEAAVRSGSGSPKQPPGEFAQTDVERLAPANDAPASAGQSATRLALDIPRLLSAEPRQIDFEQLASAKAPTGAPKPAAAPFASETPKQPSQEPRQIDVEQPVPADDASRGAAGPAAARLGSPAPKQLSGESTQTDVKQMAPAKGAPDSAPNQTPTQQAPNASNQPSQAPHPDPAAQTAKPVAQPQPTLPAEASLAADALDGVAPSAAELAPAANASRVPQPSSRRTDDAVAKDAPDNSTLSPHLADTTASAANSSPSAIAANSTNTQAATSNAGPAAPSHAAPAAQLVDSSQAPQAAPAQQPAIAVAAQVPSANPAPRADVVSQPLPPASHAGAAIGTSDIDNLALRIASKIQLGDHHFDIRLDPPELGRVDVHLSVDATGRAEAHIVADKQQSLDVLQRDSGTLHKALKDSGLDVSHNSLNFSLKGQERGDGGAQRYPARAPAPLFRDDTPDLPNLPPSAASTAPMARLDIRI